MTPRLAAQQRKSLARRYTTSLTLRRGATSIAAQFVAVYVRERAAQERRTESGEAAQADAEVWGTPALNIARGDRFTWDGVLLEVILVRPGRDLATIAEAKIVA